MSDPAPPAGLEAAFLTHRAALLRFLVARGAGDAAEDLLHELWLRIEAVRPGPIASPLSYLYRAADSLMIDRYRAERQARLREHAWVDQQAGAKPGVSEEASAERLLIGREYAQLVARRLDTLDPRAATAFRRHRIDGLRQRDVATELGISLSTLESDLRMVYRALAALREEIDEA